MDYICQHFAAFPTVRKFVYSTPCQIIQRCIKSIVLNRTNLKAPKKYALYLSVFAAIITLKLHSDFSGW